MCENRKYYHGRIEYTSHPTPVYKFQAVINVYNAEGLTIKQLEMCFKDMYSPSVVVEDLNQNILSLQHEWIYKIIALNEVVFYPMEVKL